MLIFYVNNNPIVIIDAMSSDDRFSTDEILSEVKNNAPKDSSLKDYQVFSCEYSAQFEHIGIPMGASIKTMFSATLKSPPALLVSAFSPKFLTSKKSLEELGNTLSLIPNAQTSIVYAAMVIKGTDGKTICRDFIVYAAPLYPDAYGTTTTMVLSGAKIDDVMIKKNVFFQIDKKSSLKSQLETFLASQEPAWKGNFYNAPSAKDNPGTEMLMQPMTF